MTGKRSDGYRVAMLVMAHNEPELLRLLLTRLVKDFDVFVHIDKRSEAALHEAIPASPRITRVKGLKASWGSPRFVEAELSLVTAAMRNSYERYVLVSGQCVPLLSNAAIKAVLRRTSQSEWIGADLLESPRDDGFLDRVQRVYWHAPWRYRGIKKVLYSLVEYSLEIAYRTVLRPRKLDGDYYFGQTWFALSHRALHQALDYVAKNPSFRRSFQGARLGEELFLPTAVKRSMPADTRYLGSVSYMDWERGPEKPRVLDETDSQAMKESDRLFARKVTSAKSHTLVESLYAATDK